ncbi:MAG: hypothetical protein ACOVOQ_17730 [Flavobacterium sp.]
MKTLYEKLTQENKTKLENYKEQYPTIANNLIQALQTKVSWIDLRVIEMMHLFDALEVKDFNFITPLDNIFYGK